MQGRGGRGGRRREPLNPFAQNAGAERQRRREENAKRARDAEAQQQRTAATRPGGQPQGQNELLRKAAEAQKALNDKATGTVEVESATPTAAPAPARSEPAETERQRLARLSQENKAAAQSILKANSPAVEAPVVISEETSTVTAAAAAVEPATVVPEPVGLDAPESLSTGSQNVFKQIAVKSSGRSTGQRRKGSRDKKGGGRQKQVKKLNRQKYLEYKYAARDMLADPGVAEEHRSNLLGQIWAKGERISFEAAIEYIEQKEAEGILPPTVAAELQRLIRRMETRR